MGNVITEKPNVEACEGYVFVDGPGLVVTMTPEVAQGLGDDLQGSVVEAGGQRVRQGDGESR